MLSINHPQPISFSMHLTLSKAACLVGCQGDDVGDAGHRGCHGQGQSEPGGGEARRGERLFVCINSEYVIMTALLTSKGHSGHTSGESVEKDLEKEKQMQAVKLSPPYVCSVFKQSLPLELNTAPH